MSAMAQAAQAGGDLVVETRYGKVQGVREGSAAAFHAVPYAAPPVGPLRFAAPHDPAPWSGVRDCTRKGPSAPQNASRLDGVMGIDTFERSEDCLFLDIWTPAPDGARRPVMVWLHGGAYMSGGGNQAFYTGGRLASRGDMVVVNITYRLGVLGFLYLAGIEEEDGAPANRGLLDQAKALAWIRDNIAAFGGDPGNVTVSGQSAGAGSLLALMVHPGANGLFHKGIAQSGPGINHTEEQGREVARCFYEKAGLPQGDIAAVKAMDLSKILAAQGAVVMEYATKPIRTVPWQPVTGLPELPGMPATVVGEGACPNVPMMFGWTLDEMHAWFAQDPRLVGAESLEALKAFPAASNMPETVYAELAGRIADGLKPWEALAEQQTEAVFGSAAKGIADRRAGRGLPAWVYRFDWRPTPNARFGACHCIEIPFMFDNFEDWPPAPMLEGADPASLRRVTDAVQSAWISFCRDGRPAVVGVAEWPARSAARKATMVFDDTTRLEG